MKLFILLTFILNNALFINVASAQALSKEDQEKTRFKQEAKEIYQSLGISSLVPYESFFKGYVGYFKYRKRLNGLPIITYVNYSIPSNQPRMVTIDFKARRVLFLSHA